jgi:hypothetical protein
MMSSKSLSPVHLRWCHPELADLRSDNRGNNRLAENLPRAAHHLS